MQPSTKHPLSLAQVGATLFLGGLAAPLGGCETNNNLSFSGDKSADYAEEPGDYADSGDQGFDEDDNGEADTDPPETEESPLL